MISMNTALPPSHTNQEENKETTLAFTQYLPLMFHPETFKMTKFFLSALKLIQKHPFIHIKSEQKLVESGIGPNIQYNLEEKWECM